MSCSKDTTIELVAKYQELTSKVQDANIHDMIAQYVESKQFEKLCNSDKYNNPIAPYTKPTRFSFIRYTNYIAKAQTDNHFASQLWDDFVQFDITLGDTLLFQDFANYLDAQFSKGKGRNKINRQKQRFLLL